MTLVLDASAAVDFLINTPLAGSVGAHLRTADVLVAPDLIYVEVTSALSRLARAAAVTEEEAATALERLASMPVDVVASERLLQRAWTYRHSIRISDAFYVACAEAHAAPLLTSDRRLARAHHSVAVITVK